MRQKIYTTVIVSLLLLLSSCGKPIKVEPKINNTLQGTYYHSESDTESIATITTTASNITKHSYDFSGTTTFDESTYEIIGIEKVREIDTDLVSYLIPQDRLIGSTVEATLSLAKEKLFKLCGSVMYGSLSGQGSLPDNPIRINVYEYAQENEQDNCRELKSVGELSF